MRPVIKNHRRGVRTARGIACVFVLIALMMVLAMAAIVIDLGYMRLVHCELQSAADATALACIQALDMDPDSARYVAEKYASLNEAAGEPVVLDREKDVVFGTFDEASSAFVALSGDEEEYADAVEVTVHASDVRLFFAPIFGLSEFGTSATASARYKAAPGGNFVGLSKVELKNDAYSDSYDSTLVSYSPDSATSEGGVSSNGEVKLSGSSLVNGDVFLGPGGKLSLEGGSLTGTRVDEAEALNYPEVDFSEAISLNDNATVPYTTGGKNPVSGGKLVVGSGDTLELPPGVYYFDEIKLEDNAKINIANTTKLFVTKKIDAEKGQFNNKSALPSNLQIYSTQYDPLDEIKLPAQYDTHAVVYAPSAKVTKKSYSHFFGSVIAKEFKAEGGAIHADRALLREERGTGATVVLIE